MIDPNNIINFNRTDAELEELILFLVCVAGKKASTVAVQLDKFLEDRGNFKPFRYIRNLDSSGALESRIRNCGFGCYTRLRRAFMELAYFSPDLKTCTKEQLMQIHGIGRKSASCFLAWTRKGEKVAMLDTHLLKWVKQCQRGFQIMPANHPLKYLESYIKDVNVPLSTPTSKKLYDKIEKFYLVYCEKMGLDPTKHDLEIWRWYSAKGKNFTPLDMEQQSATI